MPICFPFIDVEISSFRKVSCVVKLMPFLRMEDKYALFTPFNLPWDKLTYEYGIESINSVVRTCTNGWIT